MAIPVKIAKNISAGYGKKYTYTPNTIQTVLTLRKYLTPSSKAICKITTAYTKEANGRKQQNRLFTTNEKTYYRNLRSKGRPDCHDTLPDKQALTAFWASTWGNAVKQFKSKLDKKGANKSV